MATIAITTHDDGTVTRRTLTPVEVRSRRGVLTSKRVAAANAGRGRRNGSVYHCRAMGSGEGVLPVDESILTRNVFTAYQPPSAPPALPPTPIRYTVDVEGDRGRQYEKAIKESRKRVQGR